MSRPIVKLTQAVRHQQRDLASKIQLLKSELFNVGLVLTAQQMENVTRMVGFEIAALETNTWPESATKGMEEAVAQYDRPRAKSRKAAKS